MTTQPVYTAKGARDRDKAAAAEAAAQAAVKQAEAAQAMLAVERERAMFGEELAQKKIETRKAEQAQKQRERADAQKAKQAEDARKKAERKKVRAERLKALNARRAMSLTLVVVTASMTIAWPAQAMFFAGHGMHGFGLVAPVVIEGPQWLSAILLGQATNNQGRTWVYRLATAVFAGIAAAINYAHGSETGGRMIGVVYALASLVGVIAWELYVHSQRQAHSKRTAAERRRALQRRISYPLIYRRAVRLARATGMDFEQAWPMAWRQVHGADVGITADDLVKQNGAMKNVAKAYDSRSVITVPGAQLTAAHLTESAAKWQREASSKKAAAAATQSPAPAATQGGSKASGKAASGSAKPQENPSIPPRSPKGLKVARLPLHSAAKKAAAETAKEAQQNSEVVAQERIQAAQMYAAGQAPGGTPVSFAKVGKHFGKTGEWARLAYVDHGGLHAVPDAA